MRNPHLSLAVSTLAGVCSRPPVTAKGSGASMRLRQSRSFVLTSDGPSQPLEIRGWLHVVLSIVVNS